MRSITPNERKPLTTLNRRRGRPKIMRTMHDSGTAELIMKRLSGETTESLDLCLERKLISKNQHWCGVHLRWLYTLRFGAPGIRAVDTTHPGGAELKLHDTAWISAREEEYQSALAHLSRNGLAAIVMNICIFNERPLFLKKPASIATSKSSLNGLQQFKQGLDVLERLWCSQQ